MIRAIAIDDEPPALDIIKAHAVKVPFLQLKASFVKPFEALNYIQFNGIDLAFIDISMPDISGIELAGKLKGSCQVIFTTAYSEYALKGFELAATDYLLKPISFSRFLEACSRSREKIASSTTTSNESNSIFLKDGYDWVRINLEDVLYVKGEDNYACIYESNRKTMSRITLTKLNEQLPKSRFMRVHKSFIISVAHINRVEKNEVIVAGIQIPLAKGMRESIIELLLPGINKY